MNLGGIKTSSAEIERALTGLTDITEVLLLLFPRRKMALAYSSSLRPRSNPPDKQHTMKEMQNRINQQINPLFKIHDVVFIDELPKTASNKIMRRILRREYMEKA